MDALFQFLLRQGDNALVLGHRLSEWCGKAPMLEEDIALANTALDFIGQTQLWLALAGEVEGDERNADDLAFKRDVWDFRNLLLVERPNGDFAQTMMRQFLFDAFHVPWLTALSASHDTRIAEIAAKSLKEARYHLERSREMIVMLGDGTEESHIRAQRALDGLWPFAGEMFVDDDVDRWVAERGIAPLPSSLRAAWDDTLATTWSEATLTGPESTFAHSGGRTGRQHTEDLGHMLATMQFLPRAYPDATW